MNRLKDKVAIVTGGGTGIGEAISKKFAKEGAKVLVVGFEQDPVDDVVNSIKENGGTAKACKLDISSEENAKTAIKDAVGEWGKLDVLINNAAVFPEVETIESYSVESFDNMLKNNLRTTFLMTKYAIPELQKTKGCIVTAGSEAGKLGIAQNAPYGGTKGFNHAFMKGVAVEQAKNGIRANCVSPGPIDTAWTHQETSGMDEKMEKTMVGATPLGRRETPEEIANVYLFLASDEASYITGELLSADGGITVSKGMVGNQVPDELSKKPEGEINTEHAMDGATEKR